jgi:hypothetical protein
MYVLDILPTYVWSFDIHRYFWPFGIFCPVLVCFGMLCISGMLVAQFTLLARCDVKCP